MHTQYRGHDTDDDFFRINFGFDFLYKCLGFFQGCVVQYSDPEGFLSVYLVKEIHKQIG